MDVWMILTKLYWKASIWKRAVGVMNEGLLEVVFSILLHGNAIGEEERDMHGILWFKKTSPSACSGGVSVIKACLNR